MNVSSYANAGLYRNALEDIMFAPNKEAEKTSRFHDETLDSIKKVSSLVQKFEAGDVNEEADGSMENKQEKLCESFCNSQVFETKEKIQTEELKLFCIQDSLKCNKENELESIDVIGSGNGNDTVFNSLTETPILRSVSRQISGLSVIESQCKIDKLDIASNSPIRYPTTTLFTPKLVRESSRSQCSHSDRSVLSSASTSESNEHTHENSFNKQFSYYKIARAQVHHKFQIYFKWNSNNLRPIAANVSKMRLDTLNSITDIQDEKVNILKKIYKNCIKGVNKEMDALCCALFHLLKDVKDKSLSIHEEYVAAKYNNKFPKQTN